MVSDSIADYSKMSVQERKQLTEGIHIRYPRLLEVEAKIEHCRKHSTISAEPECLLILGDQGAGKTTLYKRYERRFPRRETEEGTLVPVLSCSIPIPATIKNLVTNLLRTLGDPFAERGTAFTQTLRLYMLLDKCKVELLILNRNLQDWYTMDFTIHRLTNKHRIKTLDQ